MSLLSKAEKILISVVVGAHVAIGSYAIYTIHKNLQQHIITTEESLEETRRENKILLAEITYLKNKYEPKCVDCQNRVNHIDTIGTPNFGCYSKV